MFHQCSQLSWLRQSCTRMISKECKANTSRPHPVPARLSGGLIAGIYCQAQSAEHIIWLLKILLIHVQRWTVIFGLVLQCELNFEKIQFRALFAHIYKVVSYISILNSEMVLVSLFGISHISC